MVREWLDFGMEPVSGILPAALFRAGSAATF
jgi:hypothetical protein